MFIPALFIIENSGHSPDVCPSANEWINKMCSIHTMEYYSGLKRNKALIHTTTWMNLENIMLSEVSQSQNDKYCMIPRV